MPHSFSPMSARDLFAKAEREAKARQIDGKPVQLSPRPVFDAATDEATVYVHDVIGGWFGLDPSQWVQDFNSIAAKTIHLRINSPGGSVFDAEAMRTAIRQHSAHVVAHIDGLAASAATGLALAANEVEMSDGAMFMIHNAWGLTAGNAAEMRKYADILDKADASIVATYVNKTGASEEQVSGWMNAETWFTASEALTNGFVDRIFTAASDDDNAGADDSTADPVDTAEREKRLRMLLLAEM